MIGVCSAPPSGALDSFRKFGLGRLAIKVTYVTGSI